METETYKKFEDLEFRAHRIGSGLQASMFFPNGYGISVVRFMIGAIYGSYTHNENEWEVAVLKGDANGASLDYSTPITDDVIGHLTADGVTNVMIEIQKLPA